MKISLIHANTTIFFAEYFVIDYRLSKHKCIIIILIAINYVPVFSHLYVYTYANDHVLTMNLNSDQHIAQS